MILQSKKTKKKGKTAKSGKKKQKKTSKRKLDYESESDEDAGQSHIFQYSTYRLLWALNYVLTSKSTNM